MLSMAVADYKVESTNYKSGKHGAPVFDADEQTQNLRLRPCRSALPELHRESSTKGVCTPPHLLDLNPATLPTVGSWFKSSLSLDSQLGSLLGVAPDCSLQACCRSSVHKKPAPDCSSS
jgi:hypothetical protein